MTFGSVAVSLAALITFTWAAPLSAAEGPPGAVNAAPAATLKVTGLPSEWGVTVDVCQPVVITATPMATGVLVATTLTEASTKKALGEAVSLKLKGKEATTAAELVTAVNSHSDTVTVCITRAKAFPGKYIGNITISTPEKPEGDPITTTVYVTSPLLRAWGGVLIFLGCVAAYVVRFWAPAFAARAQALIPAQLLSDRATALAVRVEKIAPSASETTKAIATLQASVSRNALDDQNLIPSRIPNPFGTAPDTPKYKKLLDDSSERLTGLIIIVDGLERATNIGGDTAPAVLKEIDDLAGINPPPKNDDLKTRVDAAVGRLPLPAGAARVAGRTREREDLELRVETAVVTVWLGWLALTVVTGLIVLVFNNPGFGLPNDLLYCVLWGFGLPAAGAQLTPASVSTVLNISVPKAA